MPLGRLIKRTIRRNLVSIEENAKKSQHENPKPFKTSSGKGAEQGAKSGQQQQNQQQLTTPLVISSVLNQLKQVLTDRADAAYHLFKAGPDISCALVYLKDFIDSQTIEKQVLSVMLGMDTSMKQATFIQKLIIDKQLPILQQSLNTSLDALIQEIMTGSILVVIDGAPSVLCIQAIQAASRSINEAPNESVVRGPREAFIEDLNTNLTLVKRKIHSPQLKIEQMTIGAVSNTTVALIFLEGICDPQLVKEIKRRLSDIDLDAIEGSSYLEEFIEDNPYSPFPQVQYTERPDVISASLMEGRIGIIVDGTPISLVVPVDIFMLMQAAEDYYQRYVPATWIRMIRYLFAAVSLLLPSVYVAISTFHPDMIPENLLITIASSREVVPFPALVEALMMELIFEGLREATIRIPKSVGQSVSVIGALIIGTAAVEAGIVSAAMVIIVSMTGIASFIIPHFDLALALRLLRFPIMLLAGVFGMFGIACGVILIYVHLVNLRSFGYPYLQPLAPFVPTELKDTIVRLPWWKMKERPSTAKANSRRQRKNARRWESSNQGEE